MKWVVYNVLFAIGYTLMMPKFLWRMWRRGGYRKGFLQRIGKFDSQTLWRLKEKRRIWLHAVSVGECYVAARYLREIRDRDADGSVVFSVTTSTGHRVAQTFLGDDDVLIYFPADFPGVVKRILARVRPLAVIFTESEFWPNFVRQCKRDGIKLLLINGFVSDRSYPGYRRLKGVFGPVLRCFDLMLVQGERDRDRLVEIGASPDVIEVAATAKYDIGARNEELQKRLRAFLESVGVLGETRCVLGASTWPGEELILARVVRTLRSTFPDLRLILVPRHAERGNEVKETLTSAGFEVIQRSQFAERPPEDLTVRPDSVWMADTTGELAGYYALADIVFVGKSLKARGGQNFIEPASFGKPVLVGPNTCNFPTAIRDFREADAIIEVADEDALLAALRRLLENPRDAAALAARGYELVTSKSGVVKRSVDRLLPLIDG